MTRHFPRQAGKMRFAAGEQPWPRTGSKRDACRPRLLAKIDNMLVSLMRIAPTTTKATNPAIAPGVTVTRMSFCCRKAVADAVILGSDPDSADRGWHRQRRSTESGSDPNITALRRERYQSNSCQRFIHKRYSLICYKSRNRQRHWLAQQPVGYWPAELGSEPNSGERCLPI